MSHLIADQAAPASILNSFPDKAVDPYMRLAARALAAPMSALFLRNGDKLVLRCGHGLPEALREMPYFFAAGSTPGMRVLIDDTRNNPLTRDSLELKQLSVQSVGVVQFGLESGASAFLCVADMQPRAWSAREAELLTDVACMVVMEVRRQSRRHEDAERQRFVEEARRQTEERYRRLFESSRDAIYMTTRDGKFVDANSSMLEMFGYTRPELLQVNASALYANPQDRARYQKEIEKVGSIRQHELKMRRKDGTIIDCIKTAALQHGNDGAIIGYQGIIHDISRRKQIEQRLAHDAFHDSLTELPNRALFMDRLERVVRGAKRRHDYRFGVLFLDLDRFKIVNDTLGHAIGDLLLSAAARRLETCLRSEDTVARLGGDEFAIIIDSIHDAGDATRVAERIVESMALPFEIENHEIQTGTSVGVALSSSGNETADSLLRDADAAMYRAKTSGRGRYEVFDRTLHTQAVIQLQIEAELRRAIQAREFALVYQPIMDIRKHTLAGFEAFLRWRHPLRGLLAPAEFLHVAEETGLIIPIGFWALEEACRQMRQWELNCPTQLGAMTVSVNLSGKQFNHTELIPHVDRIIAEAGVLPSHIKLEVSETVAMQNAPAALATLQQLRQREIMLSIDDFGTGFTSLSYLQEFPVASLKIDGGLVASMEAPRNTRLIDAMLAVGRTLGIDILAEKVETADQLQRLTTLGAHFAQGYYFSRPVEPDQATAFIIAGHIPQ